jgi:hypothetical protein
MENLNAEQVKKGVECCYMQELEHNENCPECPYTDLYPNCSEYLGKDALALINKQETEYNELYELLRTYKADSESYRSYSKTLEKENEGLKTLLDESYDTQNSLAEENESIRRRMHHLFQSQFIASFDEVDRKTKEYKRDIAEADILTEVNKQYQTENMVLSAVVEGLTEENERLRAEKEHNAGNEKYILSTVMVAPIDYTVRKMQKSLHERFGYDKNRVHTDYNVHRYIDQIAKEILEGENEN